MLKWKIMSKYIFTKMQIFDWYFTLPTYDTLQIWISYGFMKLQTIINIKKDVHC